MMKAVEVERVFNLSAIVGALSDDVGDAELKQNSVDSDIGVNDILMSLRKNLPVFLYIVLMTLSKFEELCQVLCPMTTGNARSTGVPHVRQGHPPKLSSEQRLL